jgi:hypothetical protein
MDSFFGGYQACCGKCHRTLLGKVAFTPDDGETIYCEECVTGVAVVIDSDTPGTSRDGTI